MSKKHKRSIKLKKNIVVSLFLKGSSILVSFLLVPMTINYLDVKRYGLWLTISSIMMWIGFFDIGMGHGLRNKFAEAVAKGEKDLARTYVSTTYAIVTLIMGGLVFLFAIVNPWLNWAGILNADLNLANELSLLVLVVFVFFALRFVLQLIGTILVADQNPAINDSFFFIANLIALIFIFILTKITATSSLLLLGIILSSTPVIVLLVASLIFYKTRYKYCKPSFKYINFKYCKEIASLGVRFFILQIAYVVIFTTDNIIITQLLGPQEVTPYNIAFKYFGIATMGFAIVLTPFWSAFTEAYHKNDFVWMKNSIHKLLKIWGGLAVGVVILMLYADKFYLLWVGEQVHVARLLSIFMAMFVLISAWNNIFAHFINGVGCIKLQTYYGIFGAIINIPLSIFFARNLGLGSAGVILATSISLMGGFILGPIQYYKIINKKASGIWM